VSIYSPPTLDFCGFLTYNGSLWFNGLLGDVGSLLGIGLLEKHCSL